MADIICRWRNGTPKTVVELVNKLPHKKMPNDKFRTIMEAKWDGFFRSPYQLACQLGLYCESEDGYYYPRFNHDINEDEAKNYLEFWISRYYIPNPYTGKDGFNDLECPTYVLKSLYDYVTSHPNCDYAEAYKACFNEDAVNNDDIVRNYINRFSKVLNFEKEGKLTRTSVNPNNVFGFMDKQNKKEFFDSFSTQNSVVLMERYNNSDPQERAQMFYEFLKKQGLADSSCKQYAFSHSKNSAVIEAVNGIAHKGSLFDVFDLPAVQNIYTKVSDHPDNKKKNNALSATIYNYKKFLDYLETGDNGIQPVSSSTIDTIISSYVSELPSFWENEKYKWIAVRWFQDNWDIDADDFASMIDTATKKHFNLLDSSMYFPLGMIKEFATLHKERVRTMFRDLFDESQDLDVRVAAFQAEAEAIRLTNPEKWRNHYQDPRAISVYLTFKYPDKYYIYKYTELNKTKELLGDDFKINKKSQPKLSESMTYMDSICQRLAANSDLCSLVDSYTSADGQTYNDQYRHILTVDFIFYVGKRYNPKTNTNNVLQVSFDIDSLVSTIKSTGLIYDDLLIKRFTYSLLTKPFVILSGLAGSGKTQLALAFAKSLIEDDSQMCVVSVGADWTNREPLLGYPNGLNKDEYVHPESGVLDILIEANNEENQNKPYFIILDEMNLSYVERYFADFLSAMESHQQISLWQGPENGSDTTPNSVSLPGNVFIIGTINVDETTYMFSPKVLDRANVIEFKVSDSEMDTFLSSAPSVDIDAVNNQAANMADNFVRIAKEKVTSSTVANEVLKSFFHELKTVNAEFGYRTATEIGRFITLATNNESIDTAEAIDSAIVQKLLPKLHGSRKKLEPVLRTMWDLCWQKRDSGKAPLIEESTVNCKDALYKESADKIQRMYNTAIDNGFTSFAEA